MTARIEKAKSIPNSEPALRIDSEGAAHAAIPFQTETLQLAIADLRFEPDGKLSGEPKLTELAQLGKRPTAAAAGYVVAATGAMRRDWVVLFETEASHIPLERPKLEGYLRHPRCRYNW